MATSWKDLMSDDPELGASVRNRFAANRHHIIGTIRPSGAPRLSGTEVVIDDSHVRIGMMPESHKLSDVRRDPRVEIHGAPLESDLADGDAKLAGTLIYEGPTTGTPGSAFVLDIQVVSLVQVDGDELLFTIWRPGVGTTTTRRA